MSEDLVERDDGDGGEVLVAVVPLTPKEEAFVRAYADPESATYGKATKSAEVAKYQEPHNAAWKLRRRPRIIERISEYEKLTRVVIGKVLTDLENTRLRALEKGDLSTAAACSTWQGRHLGMFVDVVAVDPGELPRYDARVAAEARKITAILLMQGAAAPLESPYLVAAPAAGTSEAVQDAPSDAPPLAREQSIEGAAAPGPVRATPAMFDALTKAKPQAPRTTRQESE